MYSVYIILEILQNRSCTQRASIQSIAVCDFNNDDRMDIVIAITGQNNIGILLGYGNGSFAYPTMYSTGSIASDDFNNDTHLDIVATNSDESTISVLLGHGNGTFANPIEYSTGYRTQPFSVVVGDFNSEKKVDFVVDNLEIYLQTC